MQAVPSSGDSRMSTCFRKDRFLTKISPSTHEVVKTNSPPALQPRRAVALLRITIPATAIGLESKKKTFLRLYMIK